MEQDLRLLVSLAFGLLLVMLRLDAERFGAAEYTEPLRGMRSLRFRRRLAWYVIGLVLIVGVDVASPDPGGQLFLRLGDRLEAILFGFLFASLGTLQAIGVAWLRYHHLRLPPGASYPGALLNSIATAFIDEATFRGILLAYLVLTGLDAGVAVVLQALIYALATRLGSRGRDPYMLVLVLAIGLFSGWLTITTGGIGAAFLGHAITRFAVFLTTGHIGRVDLRRPETEEIEQRRRLPIGWRRIGAVEQDPVEQ